METPYDRDRPRSRSRSRSRERPHLRESEYDLIISFNVHGDINGKTLVDAPDSTIKIPETDIIDVPTDCNITFLIASQCGVSNYIDDNEAWTHLLRTSIQKELQKHSSEDLAQRIKPILVEENKRYERTEKVKTKDIKKWNAYMDTTWQIDKHRRYYNKKYQVDSLDNIPDPFVVYYCSHPDPRVTNETVQAKILEWVEPSQMHAQKNVYRKTLIDILTTGYNFSFGFKNILIIDASCSDFVNGSDRASRYTRKLIKQSIAGGRKRTRGKHAKKRKHRKRFTINR